MRVCVLRERGMSTHPRTARPAWLWQSVFTTAAQLQQQLLTTYFRRVTEPCIFWRACGCPPQFRPSLPWWQPFAWRWLSLTGSARHLRAHSSSTPWDCGQ